MTRSMKLSIAALAVVLSGALGACTPPGGGGGGGSSVPLGCRDSILGGSILLYKDAAGVTRQGIFSAPGCTTGRSAGPDAKVLAGLINDLTPTLCQSMQGPGATWTDQFGRSLIPPLDYTACYA